MYSITPEPEINISTNPEDAFVFFNYVNYETHVNKKLYAW